MTNDISRGDLLTEQINPLSKNIDQLTTDEIVSLFIQEDKKPQLALEKAHVEITTAIELIYKRILRGGRLFYIGSGTSGRLGILDAVECPPTFCTSPDLIQGVLAGGYHALIQSSESMEDSINQSIKDLKDRNFSKLDCLVGITAGGTTPYVISALNYAKQIQALSISVSCVTKKQSNISSDVDIRLLTGPELIAGSTRLKAGTATKMLLNIISTTIMIKRGKVYHNLMVDVQAKNQKLIDRSIRILIKVLRIDRKSANNLLIESGCSVKVAIVMCRLKIEKDVAESLLDQYGGNINLVLKNNLN